MLIHMACKAQLLHTINQRTADDLLSEEKTTYKSGSAAGTASAEDSKYIRDKLNITNPSDLAIIKVSVCLCTRPLLNRQHKHLD